MPNLYTLLKADTKQVRKLITRELRANKYEPVISDDFIYAKGTVPVLLVAHYDTVLSSSPRWLSNIDGKLSAAKGLGADDRAGIYAVLSLIAKHHCHVLFTDGEERGGIGAESFTKSGIKPEVNYIIELDRRGDNDAVYYEGDNKDFEDYITEHGWKTATGSFTDICLVAPYLGVSAVNLSIGYYNEHRTDETLDTAVMNRNIQRASLLMDGQKFEWKEKLYTGYYGYGKGYDYYGGWYDAYDYLETYAITYTENDTTKIRYLEAVSVEEAVGKLLITNPRLCYNDVLECSYATGDEIPYATA